MSGITPFLQTPRFRSLMAETRRFLQKVSSLYRFSYQELHQLIDIASDLEMWDEGSLEQLWNRSIPEPLPKLAGKQLRSRLLKELKEAHKSLYTAEKSYDHFIPPEAQNIVVRHQPVDAPHEGAILGRCPVAGEKTRCCNLETLDAVKQCGFGCSYCSIQSFYDQGRVYFADNLAEKLSELDRKLEAESTPPASDPDRLRHIGTGQGSDSLMWGNRRGLLDSLAAFAERNPNVILELKTKSARTDWLEKNSVPSNLLVTWSLNPYTIIAAEEHLTAPLQERLDAARRCADRGIAIGFHFHPLVRYDRWKEEYGALFALIQHMFRPEEVVCISLGTLTFIRPVIQQLRKRKLRSKILQMPMEDAGGKLSYPREMKEELFSFAWNAFSPEWQKEIFFYLCMEDPSLWEPVFGFSYRDNKTFEDAMKQRYREKMDRIAAALSS
jgi:spore photoproduct lyase